LSSFAAPASLADAHVVLKRHALCAETSCAQKNLIKKSLMNFDVYGLSMSVLGRFCACPSTNTYGIAFLTNWLVKYARHPYSSNSSLWILRNALCLTMEPT
jgi:hypothetical protein